MAALTPDQQVVQDIKDFIATLSPEKQHFVSSRAEALRQQLTDPRDTDGLGKLAIALVGAEIAAED
jgi:hypothetical protein